MVRVDRGYWENITGPANFKRAIVKALKDRKNVLLFVQQDIPWRQQLRYSVEDESKDNEVDMIHMDYTDENLQGSSLLQWVIEHYLEPQQRKLYRAGITNPCDFISKQASLQNKIIWVKGIPEEQTQNLKDEILSYAKFQNKNPDRVRFVLEIRDSQGRNTDTANLSSISWNDYISTYDSLLFAYLISSQLTNHQNTLLQSYSAHIAAEICGFDSEIIYEFLQNFDGLSQDPLELIQTLHEQHRDTGRGVYEPGQTAQHPFYLLNQGDTATIVQRIWKAQVQVLFPYIEQCRVQMIRSNQENLEKCLPVKDSFGNIINHPFELELGTIFYLAFGNLVEGDSRFYTTDSTRNEIRLLHKVRNTLAHVDICTTNQVDDLMKHHGNLRQE